jgi:hypothetical protein
MDIVQSIDTKPLHDFQGLFDGSIEQDTEELLELKMDRLEERSKRLKLELARSQHKWIETQLKNEIQTTKCALEAAHEELNKLFPDSSGDESDNSLNDQYEYFKSGGQYDSEQAELQKPSTEQADASDSDA